MKFTGGGSEGDTVVRYLCILRSVPESHNLPFLKSSPSGWLKGSLVAFNVMSQ